ncbi:MAG: MFS transporter [Bacteroidales bacterium]|nr:MFS transporter [Bacteroidales bacterium]
MTENIPQKGNKNLVAVITMMFLYAMIAFVTNLAAPIGVVMKNDPEVGGSNTLAMLGNFMNFLAYLFMGIPAGKILVKIGYKRTAMTAIVVGFLGVFIQFISGFDVFSGYADNVIYLLGAFVSGISVCMLNIVVNPMLNLLGGGGNKGNQLNIIGGTLNSLFGTLTPVIVGALIGEVTKSTDFSQINLVLYIAMAVFAIVFVVLSRLTINDPTIGKVTSQTKFERSPWAFRHFVLGATAIFAYVGAEVGTPGTLNFYIADTSEKGAGLALNAAAIGGFVAGTYWFMMLIGRTLVSFVAAKISSRTLLMTATAISMLLVVCAMIVPKTVMTSMPLFTGSSFEITQIPLSAMLLVLVGLCTSIMWPCIFNLATEGLGKYTAQASGIFMMMVVGGGILPLIQNAIADNAGYMLSYVIPLIAFAWMFCYAVFGYKNVNKDINVE